MASISTHMFNHSTCGQAYLLSPCVGVCVRSVREAKEAAFPLETVELRSTGQMVTVFVFWNHVWKQRLVCVGKTCEETGTTAKIANIFQSRSLPLLASQEGLSGQLKSAAMVDGGVVLAGWTDRSEDFGEQEPRDFFAVKLDVEGSLVWRWKVRRLVKAGSERDGCLTMVHGTER